MRAAVFATFALSATAQSPTCNYLNCGDCIKDSGCGWCTGDIGGGNPGKCVTGADKCDTIFEKKSCPDCHKPWIRFAHAFATTETITCTITQNNITKTWSDYSFAQFSDWSQNFEVGQGTVTISSGGKTLVTAQRPLTPGPLVVVVKESVAAKGWPPRVDDNIETIAASYNPIPKGTSGLRLFDLSFGTSNSSIGFSAGGKSLADGIKYSLGSTWIGVPLTSTTFDVTDSKAGDLGSITLTPPRGANTLFVMGNKGGSPALKIQPEIDAPSVCGGDTEPPSPAPTPKPTPAPTLPPKCSVNLDLLFVVDASKSITQTNWQLDKNAIQSIANQFNFGCKDDPKTGGAEAEMGIIEFATNTTVNQPLTCDKQAFLSTAAGLIQPCHNGDKTCHGWTYTGDALEAAYNQFKSSARPKDIKVVILITDGVPCTPEDPMKGSQTCRDTIPNPVPSVAQSAKAKQWATTLKNDEKVTIATIAVGTFGALGTQFVDDISSSPASKFVFNPSSWDQLPKLIAQLLANICPPGPPPPPSMP